MFYDRRSCDSEKLNNSLSSFINKSWWLIKGSQQHRSATWARSESKSNHNQIIVVSTHSHSSSFDVYLPDIICLITLPLSTIFFQQ